MTPLLWPWLLMTVLTAAQQGGGAPDAFDLVFHGGRVVDPDSGTNAVRDLAVKGDRIVRVSEGRLAGRRVIDATGLVVAPGR